MERRQETKERLHGIFGRESVQRSSLDGHAKRKYVDLFDMELIVAETDHISIVVDQWFESHKTYVDNLEQQLQTMLNRSSAISKRQKEMMQMWTEFAQTAALIGA